MKLNWFSPLPPSASDIGHYTVRISESLRAYFDLCLWTAQDNWTLELARDCSVLQVSKNLDRATAASDDILNVYNLGNNQIFHGEIWDVSRQAAGIVVLHDITLQHLFAAHYPEHRGDAEGYAAHMRRIYGLAGFEAATAFLNGRRKVDTLCAEYPLTPLAIENALGIVVHTTEAFELLRRTEMCPVLHLPLPYPASTAQWDRWDQLRSKRPKGPFRLAVFGYLGPNRRIDAILTALSRIPNKNSFELDMYGTILDTAHVEQLVSKLGLRGVVRLHGFIEELDDALACVDLVFNLRYPTMGEASGTQLRIWDHALPSLVTQTGWYASLPSDAVAFVRPDHEGEDIRRILMSFFYNPGRFAEMGRRGRRILVDEHQPEAYAEGIALIAREATRYRQYLYALSYADKIAAEMKIWSAAGVEKLLAPRIARELTNFYDFSSAE